MPARLNIVKNGNYQYVRVFQSTRTSDGSPRSKCLKNFGRYTPGDPSSEELVAQARKFVEQFNAQEQSARRKAADQQTEKLLVDVALRSAGGSEPTGLLNIGIAPFKSLWESLGMHDAMRYLAGKHAQQFDYSLTTFYLAASRLLNPASKLSSFKVKGSYLMDFSSISDLNHIYRTLDLLAEDAGSIIRSLNRGINKLINRSITAAFYDVTTYAFESQDADALRNFGMSKDGKPGEVQVVLGLLMDQHGIPINHELFPGNTSEFGTMLPIVKDFLKANKVKNVVVVADRGLNSGENLLGLQECGCNFVIAQKLSNCDSATKDKVLDENWDSSVAGDDGEIALKYKRLEIRKDVFETKVNAAGKTVKTSKVIDTLNVKWVVTYSAKRRAKDEADLDRAVEKAKRAIETGVAGKQSKGFRSLIKFGKSKTDPQLDLKKIEDKKRWAGYYAICTNLSDWSDKQIAKTYAQLWRIENCFRLSKSSLETRPCFVWTERRIRGHFLTCYLALTLIKVMEYQVRLAAEAGTMDPIPNTTMIAALRNAAVTPLIAASEKVYVKVSSSPEFERLLSLYGLQAPQTLETAANISSKLKMRKIV